MLQVITLRLAASSFSRPQLVYRHLSRHVLFECLRSRLAFGNQDPLSLFRQIASSYHRTLSYWSDSILCSTACPPLVTLTNSSRLFSWSTLSVVLGLPALWFFLHPGYRKWTGIEVVLAPGSGLEPLVDLFDLTNPLSLRLIYLSLGFGSIFDACILLVARWNLYCFLVSRQDLPTPVQVFI